VSNLQLRKEGPPFSLRADGTIVEYAYNKISRSWEPILTTQEEREHGTRDKESSVREEERRIEGQPPEVSGEKDTRAKERDEIHIRGTKDEEEETRMQRRQQAKEGRQQRAAEGRPMAVDTRLVDSPGTQQDDEQETLLYSHIL